MTLPAIIGIMFGVAFFGGIALGTSLGIYRALRGDRIYRGGDDRLPPIRARLLRR